MGIERRPFARIFGGDIEPRIGSFQKVLNMLLRPAWVNHLISDPRVIASIELAMYPVRSSPATASKTTKRYGNGTAPRRLRGTISARWVKIAATTVSRQV